MTWPAPRWTTALLAAGLCVPAGCTRENPAFRESTSDAEASTGSADTSDTVADESTTVDVSSTSDTNTSETSDTADTTDTGPDPMCVDIPPAFDFLIYFEHATNDAALSCSTYAGNYFYAAETTNTELLMAGPCNEDCSSCEPNELAMGFEPVGSGQEPQTGNSLCVFIEAEAQVADPSPTVDNPCYFRQVTIWPAFAPATPLISISGDGAVPAALQQIPGPNGQPFSIERGTQAQCTCDDVPWCCEDDAPPTTYKLLPSGAEGWAHPGETVELAWNQLTYEFLNARSYDSGECDHEASITWVLQMQDPMVSP